MKIDPGLAQSIMDKVTSFIEASDARVMGKRTSHTIVFDENGNISHYRTIVEGGAGQCPQRKKYKK